MAKQKKSSDNSGSEKTIMEKIGDQASHIKEEIIAGKDHLVEFAGDALSSVKATLHNLTGTPKEEAKKTAKKSISKVAKPVILEKKKEAAPAKKTVKPKKAATKVAKKNISKK